jgi:hypothetical protein
MQKITKTCSTCGSEDVFVDASAVWDGLQQQWELEDSHVDESQAFCRDCNDSCTLKDEVLKETFSSGFDLNMVKSMDPSKFKELYEADFSDLEKVSANITREMVRHGSLKYGGTISGRYKQTKPPYLESYGTPLNHTILDEYPTERKIQPPESVDSYLENQCRNTPPDPLIHAKMSADKVLMRTDRDAMFPKFHADFTAGKAILTGGSQPGCDAHDAQDRVILRRHLRKHFPQAVKRVDLKSLGLRDLKAMVNTLKDIDQGDRYDG